MPHTVNGIGTSYWGRSNAVFRHDDCDSCGQTSVLYSYDTALCLVVFFVPVLRLGRKRVLDECRHCGRHRVMELREWEQSKRLAISGKLEEYRAAPTVEAAIESHGTFLGFQDPLGAASFREEAVQRHPLSARMLAVFGAQLDESSSYEDATPLFVQALKWDEQSPEARMGVGRRLIQQGKLAEAHQLLKFLEEPGASQLYNVGILETLANAYRAAGEPERALELLKLLLRELPALEQHPGFRKQVETLEQACLVDATALPPLEKRANQRGGFRKLATGLAVAALCMLTAAALNMYWRQNRSVFLVNDTGLPVQVRVDNQPAFQASETVTRLNLAEGKHNVSCSPVFEQPIEFELKAGYWERFVKKPLFVVNVGGAGLVVTESVVYSEHPSPAGEVKHHLGEPFFNLPHCDFQFVEPPAQMNLGSGGEVVKTAARVLPGASEAARLRALEETNPALARTFAEACFTRASGLSRVKQDVAAHLNLATQALRLLEDERQVVSFSPPLTAYLKRDPPDIVMHQVAASATLTSASREEQRQALAELESKRDPLSPLTGPRVEYLRGILHRDAERVRAAAEKAALQAEDSQLQREGKLMLVELQLAAGAEPGQKGLAELKALVEADLDTNSLRLLAHTAFRQRSAEYIFTLFKDWLADEALQRQMTEEGLVAMHYFLMQASVEADAADEAEAWLADLEQDLDQVERVALYRSALQLMMGELPPEGDAYRAMRLQRCAECLLGQGKVEELAQDRAMLTSLMAPDELLILAVAWMEAGQPEKFAQALDAAGQRAELCLPRIAHAFALLKRDQAPTPEEVNGVFLNWQDRVIWLVAVGQKFPELQPQVYPLARLLVLRSTGRGRLIDKILTQAGY